MAQIIIDQNSYDVPDSYLYSFSPSDNYGSDTTMQVGAIIGKATRIYRSVLSFPLSAVPVGSTINSAKLVLYSTTAVALGSLAVVYRMTQTNWIESSVTWNRYNVDSDWTTPGGDYTTSESVPWSLPTSAGSFEITGLGNLVIDAIDNRNNDLNILLRRLTESIVSSIVTLRTSDSSTNRPQLVIDYTPPKKIKFGPKSEFVSSGAINYISVDTFDENTFVVAYQDNANANHGTAKIGTVNGRYITFHSESEFLSTSGNALDNGIAILNTSGFVIAYRDESDSNHGTVKIGTVNGTDITFGDESEFLDVDGVSKIAVSTLSSSGFVVVYRDQSDENNGVAKIGSVSGTSVSFGSGTKFLSGSTPLGIADQIRITTLDELTFIVSYKEPFTSDYGMLKVGTISGTNITFGDETSFGSPKGTDPGIKAIDSSTFVISFQDSGADESGITQIGTVSGTSITLGERYSYSDSVGGNDVAILNTSEFINLYVDINNSFFGVVQLGTIDESSGILFNVPVEFLSSGMTLYSHIATLNESKFVVVYRDTTDSDHGAAKIGNVISDSVEISGNLFIQGHDIQQISGSLLIEGQDTKEVSGSLFIYGYEGSVASGDLYLRGQEQISGSGDMFVHGHINIDTSGDLYVEGHRASVSSGDLFIHGHTDILESGNLFIQGNEVSQSSGDLFIHGQDHIETSGDLFIGGFIEVSGVSGSLYIRGHESVTASGNLFIYGQDNVTLSSDLFVEGFIEISGIQAPPLFINGHDIAQISGDLFVHGRDDIQTSGNLFIEGFIESSGTQAPSLFIHGHIPISVSGNLYIEGHRGINVPGSLFIDGFVETSGVPATSLFIYGHDVEFTSGDLYVQGYDDITISGDLFAEGSDVVLVSGSLFVSGSQLIIGLETSGTLYIKGSDKSEISDDLFILGNLDQSISGNLYINGHEISTTSIDLFINGSVSTSESGNLLIDGHIDHTSSGDLFIQGQDVSIISGNLFIHGHDTLQSSGDLYIQGPSFSSISGALFINGSGIIPINDIITLFINGILDKEPVSCPILDPNASIQISDKLIDIYQSHIDALINQLGKNVVLNLPPQRILCPNCQQEIWRKRSIGVYKIGGPRPFARGRKCPYCKGEGFLRTPVRKCIKCLVKWNPKDFEDYDISIQKQDAIVRLKTYLFNMDDLLRAETAIVEYDQVGIVKFQVRRIRNAVPTGLRRDIYCISFWELM